VKTKKTTYYKETEFGPMITGSKSETIYDDDMELEKTMRRKLKWARKRYKDNSYYRPSEEFSVHGAWSKGHFEGIISVLEELLDE